MKEFNISVEICLGYHCCGSGEYITGDGVVMLEDEQVSRLVSIIQENGGETNMDKLDLMVKCPDIYEALDNACSEVVNEATYRFWLINGFECGYYDEPEGFMKSMEEAGLFRYQPKPDELEEMDEEELEDAKDIAFHEWLDTYFESLGEDDQVSFIETYFADAIGDVDAGACDYTMEIPSEITAQAGR